MPHTTINGYRHFYEDLGSGEPVVLLHGITNSSYYFRRLIPGVAAEFHVIAPHFRGMGFSERAVDIPPGAWLDDVMVLLDQLDIGSAHFYGVSLGALIGMRLTLDQPQRVRSLTLDSPKFGMGPKPPKIGTEQEPPPWIVAELRAMHGDDWQTVVRNCDGYSQSRELQTHLHIGEAAAEIAVPTLIIRGDIDEPAHPLLHATRLHELIPHSRLWIAPDTASLITRQLPAESLRIFCDFVLDVAEPPPGREAPQNPEDLELLAQIDLFAGLRRSALVRLASLATPLELRRGDSVFRQNEPSDGFYVVTHGLFGITIATPGEQNDFMLRTLGPGEFFGEMALVANQPRSASVHCEADGALLRIDGRHFHALLQRDPTASMAVGKAISHYVQTEDQKRIIGQTDVTDQTPSPSDA